MPPADALFPFADPLFAAAHAQASPADPPRSAGKRGRGATPRTERTLVLDRPNRSGSKTLLISYRRLKGWSDEHVAAAERLALLYFTQVGGLRKADDAVIRSIIEALQLYSAEHISWAIGSKAASLNGKDADETAFKRQFIGAAENFFGRYVGVWLDHSPAYAEMLQRERARELDRRLDEDAARRWREAGERPRSQQEQAEAQRRKAEQDARDAQLRRESDRVERAWWRTLSPAQRGKCAVAIERPWAQLCENNGVGVGDPQMQELRLDWLIGRAKTFWLPEYNRFALSPAGVAARQEPP